MSSPIMAAWTHAIATPKSREAQFYMPGTFEAEMKQLVVILNCRNTTVHIPNKVGTRPFQRPGTLEEEVLIDLPMSFFPF